MHGVGGSGGVGVLLLATIRGHALALAALVLFAFFTAVSMTIVSTGFGAALGRPAVQRSFHRAAPPSASRASASRVVRPRRPRRRALLVLTRETARAARRPPSRASHVSAGS